MKKNWVVVAKREGLRFVITFKINGNTNYWLEVISAFDIIFEKHFTSK